MSAATAPPPLEGVSPHATTPVRTVRAAAGEPVLPVAVARGIAFVALAAWGGLHWMGMLEPSEPGRVWLVVAVGLLAIAAMLAAGRLQGRRRVLAAVVAVVPLTALMLLAGRVADELLLPGAWGELAGGISRGISDLPGVRVPYRGLDEWVRTVIPLGGSALVLLAALLAFWPRRAARGRVWPALILLIVLYVVPVVALNFTAEFLRGAVFALLMVAFLRLEKLRRPDAAAAAALAVVATLVALIAAPLLNKDQPWFDYETWALETSSSKSTSFTWDHTYGPLKWPRDGRELLRVRAKTPAYWKAENLDDFDGAAWRRSEVGFAVPELPDNPALVRRWSQRLTVSIRNLRTDQFITAGYASGDLQIPKLEEIPTLDGLFLAPRTLRRGDTYKVDVYTPRPVENQRRRAGTSYADILSAYTRIYVTTPGLPGVGHVSMTFPFFGQAKPITYGPPSPLAPEKILAMGGLARTYALSQQLADGASTPEDYAQRVLGYLAGGKFTYTEVPPRSAQTLDGFLFDAKTGYCQQYSGAMALLLRMAGIPARVVTGFSTGATDTKTGEYIVRDFDAHSWVEAYYPGWGWITFDPTPADSPARSQPADAAAIPSGGSSGAAPSFGDPLAERGAGIPVARASAPWWRWPLAGLGALAVLGLAFAGVRRRRAGAPPALSELERALRRTRRAPGPGTTLHALELRFSRTPAAAGYVRALRETRYRDTPRHPTRAQRRGLRSELGRGSGLLGRLRAWWALPPR